jgi:hypothetical protein
VLGVVALDLVLLSIGEGNLEAESAGKALQNNRRKYFSDAFHGAC